jgi:L-malate glycosyltransferase
MLNHPERQIKMRERAKVLFLSDHLGHEGGATHGATSYFLSLLPRINADQFDLTVCFLRESHPCASQLEQAGIHPIFLGKKKWDFSVVADLIKLIRQKEINLVHAAGMKGILTGCLAANRCGAKTIVHFHDMVTPSLPVRILVRMTASRADQAIVASSAIGQFASSKFGLPESKIHIMNGILLDHFTPLNTEKKQALKSSLGIPQTAPVLISVGRLDAIKNQGDTIRVFKTVLESLPNTRLLLLGSGPLEENYKKLSRDLGLESRVMFMGHRSDVADWLGIADLKIITSTNEGLGYVAVEALSTGVPVVCYRVGGLPEVIVHKDCGELFEKGQTELMAKAVIRLLKDEGQLDHYAKKALTQAQQFDIRNHVQELQKMYSDLC